MARSSTARVRRLALVLGITMVVAVLTPAAAFAKESSGGDSKDHGHKSESSERNRENRFKADLNPVPHNSAKDSGSNVSGSADLKLDGRTLEVELEGEGLSPDLPHLAHIHGRRQAMQECPSAEARDDLVDDGLIETLEGLPDYGPILVTFSERGDTSDASGKALDRAPVANGEGELDYERTFEIQDADMAGLTAEQIAASLGDQHIVVHGEDLNDDGDLVDGRVTDFGAPLEAELPVACGVINAG